MFCRLEHVVPWVIRGAHWAPGTRRRRRAARRARGALRAVRRAARRHARAARAPPRRAPHRGRVLRRRAPAGVGERRRALGLSRVRRRTGASVARRAKPTTMPIAPTAAAARNASRQPAALTISARRGVAGRDAADERGQRPGVGLGERALRARPRRRAGCPAAISGAIAMPGEQRERRHRRERAGQRERQRDQRDDRERAQVGGRARGRGGRGRRRAGRRTALPSDQIAISGPASARSPTDSPNAGNVTSAAPTQKPIGSVVATRVRTPGLRSAPSRPPVSCPCSPCGRVAAHRARWRRTRPCRRSTRTIAASSASCGEAYAAARPTSSGPTMNASSTIDRVERVGGRDADPGCRAISDGHSARSTEPTGGIAEPASERRVASSAPCAAPASPERDEQRRA